MILIQIDQGINNIKIASHVHEPFIIFENCKKDIILLAGLINARVNQLKYFQKYLNEPHKTVIAKNYYYYYRKKFLGLELPAGST